MGLILRWNCKFDVNITFSTTIRVTLYCSHLYQDRGHEKRVPEHELRLGDVVPARIPGKVEEERPCHRGAPEDHP